MDQPYEIAGVVLNPKCAIISAITVALYYTCPTRYDRGALLTASAIAVATYVGISHYDEMYQCQKFRLKSRGGIYSQTIGQLKPAVTPILETYGSTRAAEGGLQ